MKTPYQIDELLKESLSDLKPEVPADAWSGIQHGLEQLPAGSSGITAAGKGISILTKIVIVAAIPAVMTAGYFLFRNPESMPVATVPAHSSESRSVDAVPSVPMVQSEAGPSGVDRETTAPKPAVVVPRKPARTGSADAGTTAGHHADAPARSPGDHQPGDNGAGPKDPMHAQAPLTNTRQDEKPQEVKRATADKRVQSDRNQVRRRVFPHTYPEPVQASRNEPLPEERLQIPNVFTPNGDGTNDRFIIPIENETAYYLKVMDRNGNIVFESTDKNMTWDGTHAASGQPCDAGMYTYSFRYHLRDAAEARDRQGSIQIMR